MTLPTLLKRGFPPNLNSLNILLLHLSRARRFDYIICLFTQLNQNGIEGNSFTRSLVSSALFSCHRFEAAWVSLTTHAAKYPLSLRTLDFDSLIQGFCTKLGEPDKALAILRYCFVDPAVFPSSFTFCSLIHSFVSRGDMAKAVQVLELMTDESFKYPFDNFVCSSLISGFSRIGQPDLALGFFEYASKSGALKPNIVTYTALVSALSKSGKADEIKNLVSSMEDQGLAFDVVFYTNLMYGNFLKGLLSEAFQKHRIMLERGINPDVVSYSVLIDGFSREGYVEKAVGFLRKMIKDGIQPNSITYTSIIRGFCNKGRVEEAFALFEKILEFGIEVDEFMYSTLIDGYCRKRELDRVFHFLAEMEKSGLKPSIITYNTVIKGLCKSGRTFDADEASKCISSDVITYSTLLDGYTKEKNSEGILETIRRFKGTGIAMDAIFCNVLLKALQLVGAFDDAHSLYKAIPAIGLHRDSVTYHTMIMGYCKAGQIEKALEVFDDFRRTSVSSVACYTCIIDGLCRHGMPQTAAEVFAELCKQGFRLCHGVYRTCIDAIYLGRGREEVLNMIHRLGDLNVIFLHLICEVTINLLCKRGDFEAGIEVYMMMKRKGFSVARKSYLSLLNSSLAGEKFSYVVPLINVYIKEYGLKEPMVYMMVLVDLCLKNVDRALLFLERVVEAGSSLTFPHTVLKRLTKDGRALDAYKLVMESRDSLNRLDTVDYSIIVDALCKGGHISKALDVCTFAKNKGIFLNIITYNSVLNGLCHLGCLVEACRLFDSLETIGMRPSEVTYGIIIDNLCKAGLLSDAKTLFDRMVLKCIEPNIRIWNSMIFGYCRLGKVTEALSLLMDLEKRSIKPDGFTVSTVIKGFCVIGDMEKALMFQSEFKKKDIFPDFLGYMYLIRGFSAKGRIEEARTVLREMLQSDSFLDIMYKVNSEVDSEPIRDLLFDLCERGSVQGAVAVLEEIGSLFFLPRQQVDVNNQSEFSENSNEDQVSDQEGSVPSLKKQEARGEFSDRKQTESGFSDFDNFFSLISTLCVKGELEQANRMVKATLSSTPK